MVYLFPIIILLKLRFFVSMWNLEQFREKNDILTITAEMKLESRNPLAHNRHI